MENIGNIKNEKLYNNIMTSSEKYNLLTSFKSQKLNITPTAYFPNPTDKDFTRGYIYRYFTQKANDESAPIYEVASTEYRKFVTSPLYNTADLKWRLSGPLTEEKIGAGEVVDYGVPHSNKTSIKLASKIISKLGLYLPNLKQFYKK